MMKGGGGDENINFWAMALQIDVSLSVVYMHCHRGQLVMVGCDGVQYPPLLTTPSALIQLLVAMEQGLMPHGRLDPAIGSGDGHGDGLLGLGDDVDGFCGRVCLGL